jgi:hypothetical protein
VKRLLVLVQAAGRARGAFWNVYDRARIVMVVYEGLRLRSRMVEVDPVGVDHVRVRVSVSV